MPIIQPQNKIWVVGILVKDRKMASDVNSVLGDFGDIIIGRLGVPYRERKVSIIAVIVDGTTDQIGALTGKLGQIREVKVKSAILI